MRTKDPIEMARAELKRKREEEAAAAAESDPAAAPPPDAQAPETEDARRARLQGYMVPAVHPMRAYKGPDGREYARRADILMKEWRAYSSAVIVDMDDEMFWVALFTGRVAREAITLPYDEQHDLGVLVFDGVTTDDYFPLRTALWESITNPAGPKGQSGG